MLLPLVPPDYTPRVLLANGALAFLCNVEGKSFAATSARQSSAAGKQRIHGCAVQLPTGAVLITGGVSYHPHPTLADTNFARGVYETEIYDPGGFGNPEGWTTLPAGEQSSVLRGYHSVALLLPDGRIWAGGSTEGQTEVKGSTTIDQSGAAEHRAEIFSPSYVTQANRPTITGCPANIGYNMAFTVTTPQAGSISRVAVTRCGSITHAFNSDQRYVGLNFTKGSSSLTVTAPPDAKIAPPGYYMLWIIDSQGRVCQLAKFIRICDQKCEINLDVSTFSKHEAQAAGSPARFTEAIYIVYDGFLPGEVVQPTITLRRPDNSAPPGMQLDLIRTEYEAGSNEIDTAQRIVFRLRRRVRRQPGVRRDSSLGCVSDRHAARHHASLRVCCAADAEQESESLHARRQPAVAEHRPPRLQDARVRHRAMGRWHRARRRRERAVRVHRAACSTSTTMPVASRIIRST